MNTNELTATAELEERLSRLRGSLVLSTRLTVAAGLFAAVMLAVYFTYAYNRLVEFTTPESVVTLVDQALTDNLPEVRKALQKEIRDSAPEWAETLSRQARESVPELRAELETFVVDQVDRQVRELELLAKKEFVSFIAENKNDLRRLAQTLARGEQLPESDAADLVAAFDTHFEVSFRETTAVLYESLTEMNKKLLRLKADQDLSPEERQERRLIMLTRAGLATVKSPKATDESLLALPELPAAN